MLPSFEPELWRRVSWSIFLLALVGFVSLGLAEQGSSAVGGATPPTAPLAFERQRVFGLDLTDMSSLQAIEWLNAAGNPSLALVLLPVDADVVLALGKEDQQETALAAIDHLRSASGASTLALCFKRPGGDLATSDAATAAVELTKDLRPDQISFLAACGADDLDWQRHIDAAVRPSAEVRANWPALFSVDGRDVIALERLENARGLNPETFQLLDGGTSTIFRLNVTEVPSETVLESAADALTSNANAALVTIAPVDNVDPAALAAAIGSVELAGRLLPEGFTSAASRQVERNAEWSELTVGTTRYLRTESPDAGISVQFVGTDVYLMGVGSPESGKLNVWLDPQSPTDPPLSVVNFYRNQARDLSLPIASGLAASRHTLIIRPQLEAGESITLSGVYVSGKPATAWTRLVAAAFFLFAAIGALTERCLVAVRRVRARQVRGRPGGRAGRIRDLYR